jgi:hypothetical protein
LPFFILGMYLHEWLKYITDNKVYIVVLLILSIMVYSFVWEGKYVWYNSKSDWINYYNLAKSCHLPSSDFLISNSTDAQNIIFSLKNFLCSSIRFFTGAITSLFFIFMFRYLYSMNMLSIIAVR